MLHKTLTKGKLENNELPIFTPLLAFSVALNINLKYKGLFFSAHFVIHNFSYGIIFTHRISLICPTYCISD